MTFFVRENTWTQWNMLPTFVHRFDGTILAKGPSGLELRVSDFCLPLRIQVCPIVDGSEIPRPTTWDGAKTLKIMRYLLPTSTGFLVGFLVAINSRKGLEARILF